MSEIENGYVPPEAVKIAEVSREAAAEIFLSTSKEVVEKFGFGPQQPKSQAEIRGRLAANREFVSGILRRVYGDDARVQRLAADEDVQLAYVQNIQKMAEKERVRKDGSPYYLHAQQASRRFLEFAPEDPVVVKEGVIGALLHDYLEEGDGASPASIAELRASFGSQGEEFPEELALLTEPYYIEDGEAQNPDYGIDYDALKEKTGKGRKELETVIFGLMMENSRVMQLVVPVDKLDNVGDCDIVQRKKTAKKIPDAASPEYRAALIGNLAKTIGTYLYYANRVNRPETQQSRVALEKAVAEKVASLRAEFPELEQEVQKVVQKFEKVQNNPETRQLLLSELASYYKKLDLNTAAEKFETA